MRGPFRAGDVLTAADAACLNRIYAKVRRAVKRSKPTTTKAG